MSAVCQRLMAAELYKPFVIRKLDRTRYREDGEVCQEDR